MLKGISFTDLFSKYLPGKYVWNNTIVIWLFLGRILRNFLSKKTIVLATYKVFSYLIFASFLFLFHAFHARMTSSDFFIRTLLATFLLHPQNSLYKNKPNLLISKFYLPFLYSLIENDSFCIILPQAKIRKIFIRWDSKCLNYLKKMLCYLKT